MVITDLSPSATGGASVVAPLPAGSAVEDDGVRVEQPDARTTHFQYGLYHVDVRATDPQDWYACYLEPAPDIPTPSRATEAGEDQPLLIVNLGEAPPLPQRLIRVAATRGVRVDQTPSPGSVEGAAELVVQQRYVADAEREDLLTEMLIGPWVREVHLGDGAVQLELDDTAIRISPPGAERGFEAGARVRSWAIHAAPRFAYWIVPEWSGPMRNERLVVIVASPGIRVELGEASHQLTVRHYDRKLVPQLVRVAHPVLVPEQGEPIDPARFVGEVPIEDEAAILPGWPGQTAPGLALRAEAGYSGSVTIGHRSGASVSITPQQVEQGAAFAWQVVTGLPTGDEIRIVTGGQTLVAVREPIPARIQRDPGGGVPSVALRNVPMGSGLDEIRLAVRIVEMPMADDVPPQGSPLNLDHLLASGGWYREPDAHEWIEQSDVAYDIATTAADVILSSIPIAGDVYAIGEFAYGLATGEDFWGHKLSTMDKIVLGIGAVISLIPLVGGLFKALRAGARSAEAAVRLGSAASRLGTTPERLEIVLWRLRAVAVAEDAEVLQRVTNAMRRGESLALDDVDRIGGMLSRLGAGEESLAAAGWRRSARVVDTSAREVTPGAKVADEWLRGLNTETRAMLRADRDLAATYGQMDDAVRRLLTWCGTSCLLGVKPKGDQVGRLKDLIRFLPEGSLPERRARMFLHHARGDLESAIAALEKQAGSEKQLHRFLSREVSDIDVVLSNRPQLRVDKAVRADIRRALATGLDVGTLAAVMDAAKTSSRSSSKLAGYLTELGRLRKAGITGVDEVLADLAKEGNFHTGAEWVLRFLDEGKLWKKVDSFETVMRTSQWARVIDVIIGQVRYQLKSWSVFHEATFVRQVQRDWVLSGRAPGFRWVFEAKGTLQKQEAVVMAAQQALRDRLAERTLQLRGPDAQRLIDSLPQIIEVR